MAHPPLWGPKQGTNEGGPGVFGHFSPLYVHVEVRGLLVLLWRVALYPPHSHDFLLPELCVAVGSYWIYPGG
jgi:hypothetical protein